MLWPVFGKKVITTNGLYFFLEKQNMKPNLMDHCLKVSCFYDVCVCVYKHLQDLFSRQFCPFSVKEEKTPTSNYCS